MGYCLYVESARKIDYKGGYFNWEEETVRDIFKKYCPSFYEEISDSSSHWEINREEFITMVNTIKTSYNKDTIGDIDKTTFVECCEKLIEESNDPTQFTDNEYIYLDWF